MDAFRQKLCLRHKTNKKYLLHGFVSSRKTAFKKMEGFFFNFL